MPQPTSIRGIIGAISDRLRSAGDTLVVALETTPEGISDTPQIQIWPQSGVPDAGAGNTERTTFGAATQQAQLVFNIDVFARQRNHIGEDMASLVDLIDAIYDTLRQESRAAKNYFGIELIKAFDWSFEFLVFTYGAQNINYVGARFPLTLRIY